MDKPISVGDLVQVIKPRPCCGLPDTLGRILTVTRVAKKFLRCTSCGERRPNVNAFLLSDNLSYEALRLKRIPPLSELESEKNDSKLAEPA